MDSAVKGLLPKGNRLFIRLSRRPWIVTVAAAVGLDAATAWLLPVTFDLQLATAPTSLRNTVPFLSQLAISDVLLIHFIDH